MGKTFKSIAIGTLIAGAAGYVAGLLTAPKSGKATREDLRNAADSTLTETERQLKKMHTELNELLGEAKKRGTSLQGKARGEYEEVTTKATTAKQKAREILSAVHEGDSEDKELRKALDDAKRAVDHLKKYLKK